MPFVVEADQQVRADADQFPAHEHLEEVVGEDEVEHREAEQRQEQEEAAESAAPLQMAVLGVDLVVLDVRLQLLAHVADREKVDQRGDERHHDEHERRQPVDGEAELQRRGLLVVLAGRRANR